MKKLLCHLSIATAFLCFKAAAQISLNNTNTFTENFNSIGTSASASLPTGWKYSAAGAGTTSTFWTNTANLTTNTQASSSGSPTAGGRYNWGFSNDTANRAIGFMYSGSYVEPGSIMVAFSNNTGSTITNVVVSYDYLRFRTNTTAISNVFYMSSSSSSWGTALSTNVWGTGTSGYNFAPTAVSLTNSAPLSIASGSLFYMMWTFDAASSSNGQGLGLDNFKMDIFTQASAVVLNWTGGSGVWSSGFGGTVTDGVALAFSGAGGVADNDLAAPSIASMTFSNSSGAYTITGNSFVVSNGIVNNSVSAQTFSNNVTLGNAQSFNAAAGAMTFAGNITNGGNVLTIDGAANTVISGIVSGAAGLTKAGSGTLNLSGANTFVGNVSVSGGTLQISADGALGDGANDLALNGILRTTNSFALAAGRDISGNATFDIANATTLTVNGGISNTATTLASAGTLDLQGGTRSLGNITLNAPMTLNAAGAINATGLTAPGVTSGTATINPDIIFTTTGDKTLNVAAGGAVDLNGTLTNSASTTSRIAKTGSGTLILSAANNMGGIRVGSAGATPTDGGTVILENSAVGTQAQAIQHNYGTLQAASSLVITNGLSIGGRSGAAALLAGSNMEFQGQSAFFRGTGTSGELVLNVNNTTTFSGGFAVTSGTGGTATGITLGGTGSVVISGNSSALLENFTLTDSVKLTLNNSLGGGVSVGANNAFGGTGTVGGALALAAGADFIVFDLNSALTVTGAVTLDNTFSINSLLGANGAAIDWSSVADGTYTLIRNASSFSNIQNFGEANKASIGGDRFAYFSEGSLQLNVVPEPSTYALLTLSALGLAGHVIRRRRR